MAIEEGKLNLISQFPLKLHPIPLVFGLGISVTCLYMFKLFGIENPPSVAAAISMSSKSMHRCSEEPNDKGNWINPPLNLMHTMNDSELIKTALCVSGLENLPSNRTLKIAFMFLTRGPLPLAPLWERFFRGHEGLYSIYRHSFPHYNGKFTSSSVFYNRQIPSQPVEWAKFSSCDAERRLLANALLDISNEWFVLLSEACIPLQNFSIIYQYISRSNNSFVESLDDPNHRGRYNPQMEPEVTLEQWRKGSQWFEVNRRLAVNIIEDTVYYPKFKNYSIESYFVDEHYFQTLLGIRVPSLLANRTLTWTSWSKPGPHPDTFEKSNITEGLFERMLQGQSCKYNSELVTLCFLFARKFTPSTLKPLLNLSSKVFNF